MQLSDGQLLQVWEQGYGRSTSQRALIMLAACTPDRPAEELCGWTVGQRDLRLMRLRQLLFGDQATMIARCAGCDERIEVNLALESLVLNHPASTEPLYEELDDWSVAFRVPSVSDMIAIQSLPAPQQRNALLKRCIQTIKRHSESQPVEVGELPIPLVQRVVDAMGRADPQADIDIGLTCEECGHRWSNRFDIGSFLWRELNDWAQKLLLQIHCLAKAYGWTQEEVLRLSRWRRQVYLGMARQ